VARRRVIYAPEAQQDLYQLYSYLSGQAGPQRARTYTARIETHCLGFAEFAERGTRRDELRPGLRTVGFERRVTIAFHVTPEFVVIDRILYGGRDLGAAFGEDD